MPSHSAPESSGQARQQSLLKELFSADGEYFVELAYGSVLGREPDPEGESHYLRRLASGVPKVEILDQLRRSKEATRVPPLHEIDSLLRKFRIARLIRGKRAAAAAVEEEALSRAGSISVDQFMQYHDEEFLNQLFAFYLCRQPDEGSRSHYLPMIRAGVGRQRVLMDVARSEEAGIRGKHASGERALAAALFVDRLPVIGALVAIVRFNWNLRSHLSELRALENHLYRLSQRQK